MLNKVFLSKQDGFTIIELFITMSIIAAIAGLGIFTYQNWQQQAQLLNSKEELASALVRAQQLSTAAADNTSWGIHLEEDSYTLFSGSAYNPSDPDNRTWNLVGVAIASSSEAFATSTGYGPDVVFFKFSGETYNTGTVSLISLNNPSNIKSIIVTSAGQID